MKNKFVFIVLVAMCSQSCSSNQNNYTQLRKRMVEEQIIPRGITNKDVINTLLTVPRHEFIPEKNRKYSYEDHPVNIGYDQTISQPYIVALMTELLEPLTFHKILEIGTGSGYQAAILAELVKEVYSIEIIPELAEFAKKNIERLKYKNVFIKSGDGYFGWPQNAPFDGIIVTCAPDKIPKPLLNQLKINGKMVIPVGDYPHQTLYLITKTSKGIEKKEIIPVLFVPMKGEVEKIKE